MWVFSMEISLRLLLLTASAVVAISKSKEPEDATRHAPHDPSPLSDVEHDVDGKHNPEYDQEVFLGTEEAKTFSQLTPEESKERLRHIVKKIDKDNDGYVTQSELERWVDYIHKKYLWDETDNNIKEHETDGDGALSWVEHLQERYGREFEDEVLEIAEYDFRDTLRRDKRRWKHADKDGDNKLTREEYFHFLHPEVSDHMKDIYVQELAEDIDNDKDGFLSLEEYIDNIYPLQDRVNDTEEAEWVKVEREYFHEQRDKNKDGKLDRDEIKRWLTPNYDPIQAEADHLISHADSDKDGKLTEAEIIEKYDVFVGSQATEFGRALTRHDEL